MQDGVNVSEIYGPGFDKTPKASVASGRFEESVAGCVDAGLIKVIEPPEVILPSAEVYDGISPLAEWLAMHVDKKRLEAEAEEIGRKMDAMEPGVLAWMTANGVQDMSAGGYRASMKLDISGKFEETQKFNFFRDVMRVGAGLEIEDHDLAAAIIENDWPAKMSIYQQTLQGWVNHLPKDDQDDPIIPDPLKPIVLVKSRVALSARKLPAKKRA